MLTGHESANRWLFVLSIGVIIGALASNSETGAVLSSVARCWRNHCAHSGFDGIHRVELTTMMAIDANAAAGDRYRPLIQVTWRFMLEHAGHGDCEKSAYIAISHPLFLQPRPSSPIWSASATRRQWISRLQATMPMGMFPALDAAIRHHNADPTAVDHLPSPQGRAKTGRLGDRLARPHGSRRVREMVPIGVVLVITILPSTTHKSWR